VKDKLARAKGVEALGVDYICLHVGVDEQMMGASPVETVRAIVEAVNIPVGAAGGLNSETVAKIVEAGVSIIIVGGAVYKAPNVTEATQTIKTAIAEQSVVKTDLYKKYRQEELFEVLSKVSSSNVSDAMHRKGSMKGITPYLRRGRKMVGRALTVRTVDGDWAKPVEAIDRAGKGDVVVIDAGGGTIALWGELASWSSKVKGLAGVVIDGATRDIQDILDMDFPVFARHCVPNAGEPKGYGEIGAEIVCGGQTVRTGDWIVGDESGLTVIPQERAVEIANRSIDVLERENRLREEIRRGSTLSSVLNLEKWEKVG
jgi:3-hexulose-6-phosphate synthase/6-phospho-3-hexuloisomerase